MRRGEQAPRLPRELAALVARGGEAVDLGQLPAEPLPRLLRAVESLLSDDDLERVDELEVLDDAGAAEVVEQIAGPGPVAEQRAAGERSDATPERGMRERQPS